MHRSETTPLVQKLFLLLAYLSLFLFAGVEVSAHQVGQSYVFLSVTNEEVHARIEIRGDDITRALGLEETVGAGPIDSVLEQRIKTYVEERLDITADDPEIPLKFKSLSAGEIAISNYVILHFKMEGFTQRPRRLEISYTVMFETDFNHRGLLLLQNWKAGTLKDGIKVPLLFFSPDEPQQRLDLEVGSALRGFFAFLRFGIEHIVFGFDHILFLLALILPGVVRRKESPTGMTTSRATLWEPVSRLRPALVYVVKIVTLFTIAHTVTLSLAALDIVRPPSRLVESIIAVSIGVAAADILVPIFKGRIWLVVFVFGLFHGFGFATILADLSIPPNYLLHSLLAFNLGVEIAQVALIAVLLPILYAIRKQRFYPRYLLRLGAILLILISLYWLAERALDVDLPAGAWVISALQMVS